MKSPPGLVVATAVTALEGLAVLGFGAWLAFETQVAAASDDRMASGSAVYFLAFGPLVLFVAYGLLRRQGWALGASTFLQLLALPVAFSMWQGGLVLGALALGVAALAAGWGLLQPATRVALGRD